MLDDSQASGIICEKTRLKQSEFLGLVELFFLQNRDNLEESTFFTAICKPLSAFLKIKDEEKRELIKDIIRLGTSVSALQIFDMCAKIFNIKTLLDLYRKREEFRRLNKTQTEKKSVEDKIANEKKLAKYDPEELIGNEEF